MQKYDGVADEALIQMHRNGDRQAVDELMERYKDLVRRRARALFLIGADSDDLIQEGMIGLYKAIRDYQADRNASFQTFANLCVERQMYTAMKNADRKKNLPLNTYVSLDQEENADDLLAENPETILIAQESVRDLHQKIVDSLSKMEKAVLEKYLDGFDYIQIAQRMGKSPKSIDNALQRIRTKARKQIT
ncbi:MAG: sigma-70 family RNA polymerase sigma factor [Blautia sp.]|nr:sigma-70 family RNA polymerase sigma factor [Blautia sp.]